MNDSPTEWQDAYKPEPKVRDTPLLRWAKFFSLVIVLPVFIGMLFSCDPALFAFGSKGSGGGRGKVRVSGAQKKQAEAEFGKRFLTGAVVGGMCAVGYVIWCLRHRKDP